MGDHHLCKHWPRPAPVSLLPVPDLGEDFDPVAEMRALAGRLAAAYAEDRGNAALARELRMTLLAVKSPGGDADDVAWQQFVDGLSTPTYPEGGPDA